MKTLHLILVALLLWVPPATATCELACASEQGHSATQPADSGHEHHHDDDASHHSRSQDQEGCCCISQSVATKEAEFRTASKSSTSLLAVAPWPVFLTRTTLWRVREGRSRYTRAPFSDRNRPLLI